MNDDIPDEIEYLSKVLRLLERIPEGELDENNTIAANAILLCLRNNLAGLEATVQAKRLTSDTDSLAEWLDRLDPKYPEGEFLLGFMLMLTVDDLAGNSPDPPKAFSPRVGVPSGQVSIDCPSGFELVSESDGFKYACDKCEFTIRILDPSATNLALLCDPLPEAFRNSFPHMPQFEYFTFEWGGIKVKKRRRDTVADYVLQLADGWVSVHVYASGMPIADLEAEIESSLRTIRLDKY